MKNELTNNLVFKLKILPVGLDPSRPIDRNNPPYAKKFTVSDHFELNYILSNAELMRAGSIDLEAHAKQSLKRKVFEKIFDPIIYPILNDLRYLMNQPEIHRGDLYDLTRKIDSLKYNYILFDEEQ